MRIWYYRTKDDEEFFLENWYNKEGYIFAKDKKQAMSILCYHLGATENELQDFIEVIEKEVTCCIVSQTPQCGNYDWDVE